MTPGRCQVEALRGGIIESVHRVHVAVAHADQGLIASAGNPAHAASRTLSVADEPRARGAA